MLIQSDMNQVLPEFHGSTIEFIRVAPLKRGEKQGTTDKHNQDKNKETNIWKEKQGIIDKFQLLP